MSALTIALERILKNLKQKAPEIVSCLQPGLTREEIDLKTKILPCKLPEEIYELYQWRNGFSELVGIEVTGFNGVLVSFSPLETSLSLYKKSKNSGCSSNLFQIFWLSHEFGGDYFEVVLGKEVPAIVNHYTDKPDVEYLDKEFIENNIVYPTLTNLIYAVSVCCQTILRRTNFRNGYSCPYIDREEFNNIHRTFSDKNLKIFTL